MHKKLKFLYLTIISVLVFIGDKAFAFGEYFDEFDGLYNCCDFMSAKLCNEKDAIPHISICDALARDNVSALGMWLSGSVEVDDKINLEGDTLLHVAVKECGLKSFRCLLSLGANVNVINDSRETPLFEAVRKENIEMIRDLLMHGGYTNVANIDGDSLIHVAVESNNIDVVRWLIKYGAAVNVANKSGETSLHIAARNGNFEICKCLIERGAQVNEYSPKGFAAIHYATVGGYSQVVCLLLEHGASVNALGCGDTPLIMASERGYVDMVKFLVKNGADVHFISERGYDALDWAISSRNVELVRYLIKKANAKFDANYILHQVPFMDFDPDFFEYLIGKGANVNSKDDRGKTIIHLAVECRNLALVAYLVDDRGAYVNVTDNNGWTPLHYAAYNGDISMIRYLIRQKADVNAVNKANETPLHIVVRCGSIMPMGSDCALYNRLEIEKLLLQNGAKTGIKDSQGMTPLDIARDRIDIDSIMLLEPPLDLKGLPLTKRRRIQIH